MEKIYKNVYHRRIGFPDTIVFPDGLIKLNYTLHAIERSEIKYGHLKVLPELVRLTPLNTIIIHTDDDKRIEKVNVEIEYGRGKYKTMVLVLNVTKPGKAQVVTFWMNKVRDSYPNIDESKFSKP